MESLERIASFLNVRVSDLFLNDGIVGFVKANGITHEINSVADIEKLLKEVRGELDNFHSFAGIY